MSLESIWNYTQEVQEACEPLLREYGINYFDYARFYKDGTYIGFFSENKYPQYFFHDAAFIDEPPVVLTSGAHLWDSYIPEQFLEVAKEDFNHAYGITLCRDCENYKEIFNYAVGKENRKILSLYLNDIGILYRFRHEFVDKMEKNILRFEKKPIRILENQSEIIQLNTSLDLVSRLTNRELDCLMLLKEGLTSKLIARRLNISHRTVEKHIDSIRMKWGCKTRAEVVGKLREWDYL